jgi:fermentation-respiration switch protein FrsA (DUF1100 family)
MWVLLAFFVGFLLGVLGTILGILWFTVPRMERSYVFRPSKDVLKTPSDLGVPYDQCFIDTPDGCRLSAWHLRPRSPAGSIVYFHGNGGNLGTLNEFLAMLYKAGLQVFAVDYRGYGWSTGAPTEEGLYVDAIAVVKYFKANFQRQSLPLVYWGRSLGGAVAAFAAGQVPPCGLILETSFPSKTSLLEHLPHFRPFAVFSRYKFDTLAYLRSHKFPILIVHGDRDKTIPLRQGQKLYTGLEQPKEFWLVEGAGHIDIHMKDSERYLGRILQFIRGVAPQTIH